MDKEKYMVGKIILATLAMLVLLAVGGKGNCLAASLDLDPSGSTWDIGTVAASTTWTSDSPQLSPNTWTVTNDSGSTEHIAISCSASSLWQPAASVTTDRFVLTVIKAAGGTQNVTASDVNLFTNLANGAHQHFGLQFQAPAVGSEQGAHSLTITLTAVAISCDGYYNTYCWYQAPAGNTCTQTCSSHGGDALGYRANVPAAVGYDICMHFNGSTGGWSGELCSYASGYVLPSLAWGNCYYDIYGSQACYDPNKAWSTVIRYCACVN